MKSLGKWSWAGFLTLVGVIAAILAIPGMPKLFHWDTEPPVKHEGPLEPTGSKPLPAPPKPIQKVRDVTSGQVNFGCDQTLSSVETPVVLFGKNPRDIVPKPFWANTDNVKSQNQSVINVEDPSDHHLSGVKAVGSISGRDSQTIIGGIKNCPGGGHGELTLHVTWTEDE